MKPIHWAHKAYLSSMILCPLGYLFAQVVRGDLKFTKLYVNRSEQQPPEHLRELFESELQKAKTKTMLPVNMHWAHKAYLSSMILCPLGYLFVQAAKRYVKRSEQQPPEHLRELFESELQKAKTNTMLPVNVKLTLTDELEPKTYGYSLLKPGAEIQLPMRMAFRNAQEARQALDDGMGIPRYEKVNRNTRLMDAVARHMVLSPKAKRFAIQREIQRAQRYEARLPAPKFIQIFSVTKLLKPVGLWCVLVAFGYLPVISSPCPIRGACIVFVAALGLFWLCYYYILKCNSEKQLDRKVLESDLSYAEGAQEYLETSRDLGRHLRYMMGKKGEKEFDSNGNNLKTPISWYFRLSEIKKYLKDQEDDCPYEYRPNNN
uniref:T2SSG domain-containing protein n=1 Tax=Steinernema glaseri TaxID=37863 RepID=A0A1I8AVI6_9BILA